MAFSRMQLTLDATRRTPHSASHLMHALFALSVKTRRCRDATSYGHATTAMHILSTPTPPNPSPASSPTRQPPPLPIVDARCRSRLQSRPVRPVRNREIRDLSPRRLTTARGCCRHHRRRHRRRPQERPHRGCSGCVGRRLHRPELTSRRPGNGGGGANGVC